MSRSQKAWCQALRLDVALQLTKRNSKADSEAAFLLLAFLKLESTFIENAFANKAFDWIEASFQSDCDETIMRCVYTSR